MCEKKYIHLFGKIIRFELRCSRLFSGDEQLKIWFSKSK